jgi:hypothetical protein
MRRYARVAVAAGFLAVLGACSVKEEKTVQQPSASAPASTAPAGTTTSKTCSLF